MNQKHKKGGKIQNTYTTRIEGRGGVWAAGCCEGAINTGCDCGGSGCSDDVEGGWATVVEGGWDAPLREVKSSCLASFFAGNSAAVVGLGGEFPPFSLSSIVSNQLISLTNNWEKPEKLNENKNSKILDLKLHGRNQNPGARFQ